MAKSDGRGTPGGTGMLLLALLERRDMYGYEMVEALRAQSKEIFHLKAGTLYPLLHTLEAQGWVTSSDGTVNGRTRAHLFHHPGGPGGPGRTAGGVVHLRRRGAWRAGGG